MNAGPGRGRSVGAVLAMAVALCLPMARTASAQLAVDCGTGCGLLLGASSLTFALGTTVAVGRAKGGFHTLSAAGSTLAAAVAVSAGTAVALRDDGRRQRRAARASVIGAVGGGLTGLALESLLEGHSGTTRFAAVLVGAAAGVVVGGAIGVLTYEGSPPAATEPMFAVSLPFPTYPPSVR